MVLVSFYNTDRFGRRALILIGGTGLCIGNIVLGCLGLIEQTDAVLRALTGVLCIWVIIYGLCLGGVGWSLVPEVATPRLRARTTGFVINGTQTFSLLFGYVVSRHVENFSLNCTDTADALFDWCWVPRLGRQDFVPICVSRWHGYRHQLLYSARGKSGWVCV